MTVLPALMVKTRVSLLPLTTSVAGPGPPISRSSMMGICPWHSAEQHLEEPLAEDFLEAGEVEVLHGARPYCRYQAHQVRVEKGRDRLHVQVMVEDVKDIEGDPGPNDLLSSMCKTRRMESPDEEFVSALSTAPRRRGVEFASEGTGHRRRGGRDGRPPGRRRAPPPGVPSRGGRCPGCTDRWPGPA